jgi:hypothetical protein
MEWPVSLLNESLYYYGRWVSVQSSTALKSRIMLFLPQQTVRLREVHHRATAAAVKSALERKTKLAKLNSLQNEMCRISVPSYFHHLLSANMQRVAY